MTAITALLNLLAAGFLAYSLFKLRTMTVEFDAYSRTMLNWFLGILTFITTTNLITAPFSLSTGQSAMLDLLLDIAQFLTPIFFLIFVHAFGQWRWHTAINLA